MTPLRRQMIEAMRQRGFSPRTHESYLGASYLDTHSNVTEVGFPIRSSQDTHPNVTKVGFPIGHLK